MSTPAGTRGSVWLDGPRAAGLHTERWAVAREGPRSVYLCRLSADRESRAIKLLVLR